MRPVHAFEIGVGSGIELGPDFVLGDERSQTMLHGGLVQGGAIGQQHDLEERKLAARPHMHHRAERIRKYRAKRRLAIAADGHMSQGEQFIGQVAKGFEPAQLSFLQLAQGVGQFVGQHVHIHLGLA